MESGGFMGVYSEGSQAERAFGTGVKLRRGAWSGLDEIQFPCPRDGLCATVNAELAADVVDVGLDCA